MKVSLNWAQELANVPLNELGTDKLIEKIGAQLGAVEEIVNYSSRYDGIIVAKVITCEKHPNADKLHVCTIDDGGITENIKRDNNGLVQVVCGAPNVAAGLMVAWLPPGVTVPNSLDKDPFVLEAREIRGVVSNGMLASPSELAISDNHDGILVIDDDKAEPGQPFKQLFGLDDVVIDIENKMFTHRPDCFGVLGVARELAGIQAKEFKSPDWYLTGQLGEITNSKTNLDIKVETDLVSRFSAVAMNQVAVKPSPTWLQAGLVRVGLKPINNIVDITNYLMYITGQPLHAYDADKLPQSGNLTARMSHKGEKVALLNGKELELQDDSTIIIASGDKAVGIGGAMGGKHTEVDDNTKNIIIECASFDMYNIRRTSMKYGLFTDAVTRFTKGQSNLQNLAVLARAVTMITELAGGQQSSSVADVHQQLPDVQTVEVSADFVNQRLGSSLSAEDMARLLRNVEFEVNISETLHIVAPFWRTDIEIAEDIVEEIGRLHGFDNLPLALPPRPAKPANKNQMLELKNKLRTSLSSAGANELLSYSFVHGNMLEKATQDIENAFQLSNALSPDLQYYRTSLTPSLLDRVHPNVKAGYSEFAMFEFGVTHNKLQEKDEDGLPHELPVVALVTATHNRAYPAYYQARAYLEYLAKNLGVNVKYEAIHDDTDYPVMKPFDLSRAALVSDINSGEMLGIIGEYKQSVLKAFKLPLSTAGFELDLDVLLKVASQQEYLKLPKYPRVQQDISLRAPATTSYQSIYSLLSDQLLNQPDTLARLDPIDIYQRPDDKGHIQFSFRLNIAHYNKTLKSEEVNSMLDAAALVAEDKLQAVRI